MGGLTPPIPLSKEHDRLAFDCERETINSWLRRHAWDNHLSNISRVSVVCDSDTGVIAGFVALSVGQIERDILPKAAQRNKPKSIPILLLGQLAVDRRYRGQKIAGSLLAFSFRTALQISRDAGCFGVLTHPLDDEVRALYQRFGFEQLVTDPKRAMIARTDDLLKSGF